MARRRNGAAKQAVRAAGAAALVLGAAAVGGAAGCLQILGDEGPFVLGTGGGGTGGAGAAGGSGGTGGTGGASGCEPGAEEACYEGPDGTLDEGVCAGGIRACAQDGTWGACTGQVLPGVETCASMDDEDCDKKECARWSLISGGDGGALGTALATDSKGNVIVAGIFGGKVSFGDLMLDAMSNGPLFLAKIDPAGKPIWAKGFGGGGGDLQGSVKSLAIDENDDIVLAGSLDGALNVGGTPLTSKGKDFFVSKFTSGGSHAWSKNYGGDMDQEPWNMVLDSNGRILITGHYSDGFLIGAKAVNGAGIFIVRLSPSNGDVTYVDNVDPLVGQYTTPLVAAGPGGTWVLSGRCANGAEIGGQTLAQCSSFVAQFAADDSLLWAVDVPRAAHAMAVATDGSVMWTGAFSNPIDFGQGPLTSKGQSDIFVAKLAAADGATQWAKPFGGPGDDLAPQLAIDSQDRLYIALNADDDIDFGGGLLHGSGLADAFVAALDADGNHRWSRAFGDATTQSSTWLAVRDGGAGLIVSANTPGEIDFGAGVLQPTSAYGVAIAELGP